MTGRPLYYPAVTAFAAAIIVSACGQGVVASSPDAAAGMRNHSSASSRQLLSRSSSNQDLLYVSDGYATIYVLTYPEEKLVGSLTGLIAPVGECSDAAGDVFVVGYASRSYASSVISEYAHGGTTPIQTLDDPGAGVGCAVDSTTGNLAIANTTDDSNPYGKFGSVAVYQHAEGSPSMYYASGSYFKFCGFDDHGNLYLTALIPTYGYDAQLARLPTGSTEIEHIDFSTKLYENEYAWPSVQWDGKHMTVTSDPGGQSRLHGPLLVYRLKVNGSHATVIGTTKLSSVKNRYGGQTWIQGKKVVGIDFYRTGHPEISLWPYPMGGGPRHSRRIPLGGPLFGVTVSTGR